MSNFGQPNEKLYFPELDGLRFLAFLLVFTHHDVSHLFLQTPYLSIFGKYGYIGVDLFFVLSAFLFTKLLLAEYNKTNSIDIKKFYLRRIFRIWPIYFLFILVAAATFVYEHGYSSELMKRIIGLYTFTDNIFSSFLGFNMIGGHFWSISYEEQFYIFIPVIILALAKMPVYRKMVMTIAILIILNCIRLFAIYKKASFVAIWTLPFTHFDSIVLGIIIGFGGFNYLAKKVNSAIFFVLSLLLFISLNFLKDLTDEKVDYSVIINYNVIGFSVAFLLIAIMNNDLLKSFFSHKWLVFLGKRSYGLYLYHMLCNRISLFIVDHFSDFLPTSMFFIFLYSISLTILAAIISYQFIEKPFLKLKQKYEIISSRPI